MPFVRMSIPTLVQKVAVERLGAQLEAKFVLLMCFDSTAVTLAGGNLSCADALLQCTILTYFYYSAKPVTIDLQLFQIR